MAKLPSFQQQNPERLTTSINTPNFEGVGPAWAEQSIADTEKAKTLIIKKLDDMRKVNAERQRLGQPVKYPPAIFDAVRNKAREKGVDIPDLANDPIVQQRQTSTYNAGANEPVELTGGEKIAAGLYGAARSADLGLSDEAAGAMSAAFAPKQAKSLGDLVQEMKSQYVQGRDYQRQMDADIKDAAPGEFGTGQLIGTAAQALMPVKTIPGALAVKAAPTALGQIGAGALTGAKAGAAGGAASGFGESEAKTLPQLLAETAQGSVQGATLGGVVGGLAGALPGVRQRAAEKTSASEPLAIETLAGGQEINPAQPFHKRLVDVAIPAVKSAALLHGKRPIMAAGEAAHALKAAMKGGERPLSLPAIDDAAVARMTEGVPQGSIKAPFDDVGVPNIMPDDVAYQKMLEGVPEAGPITSLEGLTPKPYLGEKVLRGPEGPLDNLAYKNAETPPKTLQELMAEADTQVRKTPAQSPAPVSESAIPPEYANPPGSKTGDIGSAIIGEGTAADALSLQQLQERLNTPSPGSRNEVLSAADIRSGKDFTLGKGTKENPVLIGESSRGQSQRMKDRLQQLEEKSAVGFKKGRPKKEAEPIISAEFEKVEPRMKLLPAKAEAAAQAAEQFKPVRPGWTQMGEQMKGSATGVRQQLHMRLSAQGNRILEEKFDGDVGAMLKWVKESGIAKDPKQLQTLFGKGFTRDMARELGFEDRPKDVSKPSEPPAKSEKPATKKRIRRLEDDLWDPED